MSVEEVRHQESHPWLLIRHGKHLEKQILYSLSEKKSYYTDDLPVMRNKSVQATNSGWLLLEDYEVKDCCLLNFQTGEKLNLPKTGFNYFSCMFSSVPTDPSCRILFLDFGDGAVRYCNVGDDKYLKEHIFINDFSSLVKAIAFGGKIYGLTSKDYALVEVEFIADFLEYQQVVQGIERPGRPSTICCASYLVESDGELLFVHRICVGRIDKYDQETIDFKVFRADFEKNEWVKMKSLGDRAIFVSRTEAKSCLAYQANIKGNCIYFTTGGDRNLYVFDMEDRSVLVSLPCDMVDNDDVDLHWI